MEREDLSWRDLLSAPPRGAHILQLYENPVFQTEAAAFFALEGLRRKEKVCLMASKDELASVGRRLDQEGPTNAWWLRRRGDLTLIDPEDVRARILVNGLPDEAAFTAFTRDIVEGARRRYRGIRFWGNLVGKFLEEGNPGANIALEERWRNLRADFPWVTLCSYHIKDADPDLYAEPLWEDIANHTHLIPDGRTGMAFELRQWR